MQFPNAESDDKKHFPTKYSQRRVTEAISLIL